MRVGLKWEAGLALACFLAGLSANLALFQEISSGALSEHESVSLFVCPQDECAEQLIEFIGSAEKSVHVMIYSLTKEEIAEALAEARKRGLDVRVVMDKTQAAGPYSKDEFLAEHGVPVKLVDPEGYAIMHHKVTIVDGSAFSTGSFNYSENADSGSAENLLLVHSEAMASRMEQEFEALWNAG